MSFRIFAAGSTATGGPFNVSRAGLDIGDVYEAVEAFSAMATAPVSARVAREGMGAAVGSVARDEAVSRATVTSPHRQGMMAIGRITGAELFGENLNWMLANCAPMILFIAVRGESSLLSGTPTGTVQMRFQGDEHAAASDLFRRLNPVLNTCGMNSFGVLAAVARVFGDYVAVGGAGVDGQYRLNIDVTAT